MASSHISVCCTESIKFTTVWLSGRQAYWLLWPSWHPINSCIYVCHTCFYIRFTKRKKKNPDTVAVNSVQGKFLSLLYQNFFFHFTPTLEAGNIYCVLSLETWWINNHFCQLKNNFLTTAWNWNFFYKQLDNKEISLTSR